MVPSNLDHILLAAHDLDDGIDWVESKLGVRPARAGSHPQFGTHNAILSLGGRRYLEVIAPDPRFEAPRRGSLFDFRLAEARLAAWVLRVDDLDSIVAEAAAEGLGLGQILSGVRETSSGTTLHWKFTDPFVRPFDGAVPFLIDWGKTPHPAAAAPSGGELVGFCIETPDPRGVAKALASLGAAADVLESATTRLVTWIETENGTVELA